METKHARRWRLTFVRIETDDGLVGFMGRVERTTALGRGSRPGTWRTSFVGGPAPHRTPLLGRWCRTARTWGSPTRPSPASSWPCGTSTRPRPWRPGPRVRRSAALTRGVRFTASKSVEPRAPAWATLRRRRRSRRTTTDSGFGRGESPGVLRSRSKPHNIVIPGEPAPRSTPPGFTSGTNSTDGTHAWKSCAPSMSISNTPERRRPRRRLCPLTSTTTSRTEVRIAKLLEPSRTCSGWSTTTVNPEALLQVITAPAVDVHALAPCESLVTTRRVPWRFQLHSYGYRHHRRAVERFLPGRADLPHGRDLQVIQHRPRGHRLRVSRLGRPVTTHPPLRGPANASWREFHDDDVPWKGEFLRRAAPHQRTIVPYTEPGWVRHHHDRRRANPALIPVSGPFRRPRSFMG